MVVPFGEIAETVGETEDKADLLRVPEMLYIRGFIQLHGMKILSGRGPEGRGYR